MLCNILHTHLLPALLAVQLVPELLQALDALLPLVCIILHLLQAGAAGGGQVLLTGTLVTHEQTQKS
jgi:hypothetical protein